MEEWMFEMEKLSKITGKMLFDMKLGEELVFESSVKYQNIVITRVIGGWIHDRISYEEYRYGPGKAKLMTSTFVSESFHCDGKKSK
jgi:hypothetical protein